MTARLWLSLALSVPAGAQADARSLQLRAAVGVGAHSRSFTRPLEVGTTTLPAAYVPAVEGSLGLVVWPEGDSSWAVTLSYQTGLWLTVTEVPPFANANEVSARSQRLALHVAPSWRVASRTQIGFALGASLRSFWPEDHALQTPGYSLFGPHVRGELAAALFGPLRLRVTPELQWLVVLNEKKTVGAAIGGELLLELSLNARRTLALSYRESHALLAHGARFRDVERYLTMRIVEAF